MTPQDGPRMPAPDLSDIIKSKRFKVVAELGKLSEEGEIGHGDWGIVYNVWDKRLHRWWAAKIVRLSDLSRLQMIYRGLNEEDLMPREARGPLAAKNVAPGFLYTDDAEIDFLLMDKYDQSVEDLARKRIQRYNQHGRYKINGRYVLKGGFSVEEIIDAMKQITNGVIEFYDGLRPTVEYEKKLAEEEGWERFKRGESPSYTRWDEDVMAIAHGDLKFDNLMVNQVRKRKIKKSRFNPIEEIIEKNWILIADKGTATCDTQLSGANPRDNIGTGNIRAPELYKEKSRPKQKSDAWSLGCDLYRFVTGEYPFQEEIAKDPSFLSKISAKSLDKLVRKKTRKIPRLLRDLDRELLSYYEFERPDMESTLSTLSEIEKKSNWKEYNKDQLARYGPKVGLALSIIGTFTYFAMTHEANKMDIPDIHIRQTIYKDADKDGIVVFKLDRHPEFDGKLNGLSVPTLAYPLGYMDIYTNHYYVARLLELYSYSLGQTGGFRGHEYLTEEQRMMYYDLEGKYAGGMGSAPLDHMVGMVIGYALGKASVKHNKTDSTLAKAGMKHDNRSDTTFVNTEDFAVIARLGKDRLTDAWKYSGSFKFKEYIDAKYPDGKRVVEEKEKEFIEEWIFNINNSGRYLRIDQASD